MEMREIRDLVVSAVVIALAFAIAFTRDGGNFITAFSTSLIAVALSFICHELGHRTVAKKFGLHAEYRMWVQGLVLALLLSFAGFVFAAPGAVYITARRGLWGEYHQVTKKMNGLISAAGPLTNIVLAALFLFLTLFVPLVGSIAAYGVMVNAWLAIFNLVPFGPLDGGKILSWDKRIWAILMAVSIGIFAFASF